MTASSIPLEEDYQSSLISGDGYDPSTETLAVRFRSTGETFHYAGCSQALYDQMKNSASKGQFFHRAIKSNLQGVKVG